MKILENRLYLEVPDAIEAGIPENTIWKAKQRSSPSWCFIADPQDKRKVLIDYEHLRPNYKEMIVKRMGDPYQRVAKEPIRKMVRRDLKAHDFFLTYRFDGDKCLPIEHVEKYTTAAGWLNMLSQAEANRKEIKKLLNLSITDFWIKVCEVITSDKIDLPTSYRRLREKIANYQDTGYTSLIHAQFGNNNSAKVESEQSKALLLEMIAHPNQYDDVYICAMYNGWAAKHSQKAIHPATVGNWRRDNEHLIIAQRSGSSAFNEKYIRQVKGSRPTAPLYMVEHDDNNLDFLFLNPDDDTQHKHYYKYVAICVTDSHCDHLLGKCYIQGDSPKKWMVRAAYLNAMYYIRSLTGGWYLPFELKGDRWAKKELFPFYNSIGNFVPPSHGNKHRGYIEQFFRSPLWKRSQKIGNDNWSGNNMTAINRGVNIDALALNKNNRPTIGKEAEDQIETFFHRLRHMPDIKRTNMAAMSKEQQWLAAWDQLPHEKRRPISDQQFLNLFGIKHEPQGRPITITNRGVEPQINGVRYSYDLPQGMNAMPFIGASVNVIFDPYDMSRVLVTNDKDIRFIATDARLQPRALKDQYTNSRMYLNAILGEKKDQVEYVGAQANRRMDVLNRGRYSSEAVLQGGAMVKELKNAAESHYQLPQSTIEPDYDPLDDM